MTTLYRLEILTPLGVWTPAPESNTYRSMTGATIAGVKLIPAADFRTMPVYAPETQEEEDHG
jgi:hypothetical protein